MKTVFIADEPERLKKIYSESIINELNAMTDISPNVYTTDYVRNNYQLFEETEYIFSTWSIPEFDEDEVKTYFPNLKCVFYAAGSVQHFARSYLKHGVKVFSAWAANAIPVAEFTTAQIILANKGFHTAVRILKTKDYELADNIFRKYTGNYNTKIGIIGAGMIGREVIKMLKQYKVETLVYDPFLSDDSEKELLVKKASLEEIFSSCNVISNHLADNQNTKNIFNYKLFSSMPKYSTFINTGRGAQVIEQDLIQVLLERPDITALLDVTNPEPPLDNSKLFELDNCILTPHMAGSSTNEFHRMAEYMLEEFKCYLNNKPCKYEVTLQKLETMA